MSSGINSPQEENLRPMSQEPPKEFKLIEKTTDQKINWFDINLMEKEDESFTLGFED